MLQRPRRDMNGSTQQYANPAQRGTGYGTNRPRANYDRRSTPVGDGQRAPRREGQPSAGRAYRVTPDGNVQGAEGIKRPRQRIGMSRANAMSDNSYSPRRPQAGQDRRSSYGNPRPTGNRPRPGSKPYGNRRPQAGRPMQRPQVFKHPKVYKFPEVVTDPNEEIRLNKFLANAGICSRREADEYITKGEIKVNGEVVTTLGKRITRQDVITFADRPVQIQSKVYLVMNKPRRCLCTPDGPEGTPQVLNLLGKACQERVYSVGRLNRSTTGVLLLTNDGELASKLTHPDIKKKAIYQIKLDKPIPHEDMQRLVDGVSFNGGELHAEEVRYTNEQDFTQIAIELHTGINNSVHRLFSALGYRVIRLNRIYFAGLTLKGLPSGKWRYLNEQEVAMLREGKFE